MADDWEVEKLLEYRSKYRKDYWLVKWKGFNEDRNTWEPWESFLDDVVQQEALRLTGCTPSVNEALPKTTSKLTLV